MSNRSTITARRARLPIALGLLIGGLSLSACGTSTSAPRATAPAEVTVTATGASQGVHAVPARTVARGAVRFTVTNAAKAERGAELIQITGGHSLAEAFAAVLKAREGAPTPGWVRWAGGMGVLHPGQRSTFTVDLAPGRYFLVDRSFQGRPSTLTKLAAGAELTVTPSADPAPLAAAASTITATEYRFRGRVLRSGRQTVRLQNVGVEPHNFVISPLRKGRTLADVKRYVATDSGAPPVDFARETISGVLAGGSRQDITLDLRPGTYALLCFAGDRAGGPPHVVKGMLGELTVPRP